MRVGIEFEGPTELPADDWDHCAEPMSAAEHDESEECMRNAAEEHCMWLIPYDAEAEPFASIDRQVEAFKATLEAGLRSEPCEVKPRFDEISRPAHYNSHPSGVECIVIAEGFGYRLGNAIKYIWRAGLKGDGTSDKIKDLRKAIRYIEREIATLEADF